MRRAIAGRLGPYAPNAVVVGDCATLIRALPDESVDIVVTSPPYWGQRLSHGHGVEPDPREYLHRLVAVFTALLTRLKPAGVVWINLGDAYNTPINWRPTDRAYSSLGPVGAGLDAANSAYTKPRARRRAFVEPGTPWLRYGNLLALPYRLVIALCDAGYAFRGEVIWRKRNAMPEGRCRRPHRQHESIYLLARGDDHAFRTSPPVHSVWEFGTDRLPGPAHHSRFPQELPAQCIAAYGRAGADVVVLDPFCGSGTTGLAAARLGCTFLGFEIDPERAAAANAVLHQQSSVPARAPRAKR